MEVAMAFNLHTSQVGSYQLQQPYPHSGTSHVSLLRPDWLTLINLVALLLGHSSRLLSIPMPGTFLAYLWPTTQRHTLQTHLPRTTVLQDCPALCQVGSVPRFPVEFHFTCSIHPHKTLLKEINHQTSSRYTPSTTIFFIK